MEKLRVRNITPSNTLAWSHGGACYYSHRWDDLIVCTPNQELESPVFRLQLWYGTFPCVWARVLSGHSALVLVGKKVFVLYSHSAFTRSSPQPGQEACWWQGVSHLTKVKNQCVTSKTCKFQGLKVALLFHQAIWKWPEPLLRPSTSVTTTDTFIKK